MHQPDICMLQSHKDPTLREQQLQHVCWNAHNSKCNTKHGVLAALLKAQDNLAMVINCLTVYETCTKCPVPHKRAQPCIITQTGMPSYQKDWDRNSLLTTETVLTHGTEHKSLAPMSAYKAAYIEKSCWEKPKTTSGNRPELRTHLIPKECLCHSASDIAGRMTNLALGSKVTSLSIHSSRFSQRIRVSLAHLQSALTDISYRLETRLPRWQAKCSVLQVNSSSDTIQ